MRKLHYFLRGRLLPCALLFVFVSAGGVFLALFLPRLLAPIAAAERAFSLAVGLFTACERDLPERKLAKLLLLFLPWTGAILCLVFRSSFLPVKRRHEGGDLGHGTLVSRLGALSAHMTGLPSVRAEAVSYFAVGREMYAALIADLKAAKERVYLEYYIVARGVFWGDVCKLLIERAKEGVDVRLIYDGFGCGLTLPEDYPRELEALGVKTAVFRRPKFGRGFSRRDHRKLAVIDDAAYTGGVNLADEYIGEKLRFGHWKDTAVRIQGDVSAFSELFLRTWYALRPSDAPVPAQKGRAGGILCVPLSDGADRRERLFPKALSLLAAHAKEKLYFFTPYLSLPQSLLGELEDAAKAGVDVRVVIPHIPDKKSVFLLTRAYARLLEERGISVREYTAGFLHAKSLVADGEYALVSSCNLDFRSLYVQAECGAFIADMPLAEAVERDFSDVWKQSEPVKPCNSFARAAGRLLMLLAPLT